MIDRQDIIALLVGFLVSVPGLIAFLRLWREEATGRTAEAAARADALGNQVTVHARIQEQMQQQITAQQQTIRFLTRRVGDLEASRERDYAETEALRQENAALRHEIAELHRGLAELFRQMEAAKLTPSWRPEERSGEAVSARKRPAQSEQVALRRKLVEFFSLAEVNDLAFELDIHADDLEGSTLPARARSLVSYLHDRGRLAELVELCRSHRPDAGF